MPLLEACVNGARRPAEHPALPISAEQLARDAAAVAAAGAGAVHLHVKDADGADTLDAGALADVLVPVRAAVPGRGRRGGGRRRAARPRIGVEAGIWHGRAAEAWSRSPLRDACLRVLVELPDRPYDEARALGLVARVDGAVPLLLHGEGASAWPAVRTAARLVPATRIGLEDVLTLSDGTVAPDNAGLVRAAVTACDFVRANGHDVAGGG